MATPYLDPKTKHPHPGWVDPEADLVGLKTCRRTSNR
jgi:hypothetical protein